MLFCICRFRLGMSGMGSLSFSCCFIVNRLFSLNHLLGCGMLCGLFTLILCLIYFSKSQVISLMQLNIHDVYKLLGLIIYFFLTQRRIMIILLSSLNIYFMLLFWQSWVFLFLNFKCVFNTFFKVIFYIQRRLYMLLLVFYFSMQKLEGRSPIFGIEISIRALLNLFGRVVFSNSNFASMFYRFLIILFISSNFSSWVSLDSPKCWK